MLNNLPGHRAGIKGRAQERFAPRNLAPEALGSAIFAGIGTYPCLPDSKPGLPVFPLPGAMIHFLLESEDG